MKVFHDPAVLEELILLAGYIAEDDEETAQKFLDSCDKTFHFLAQNRFIGTRKHFDNPALSELRMWRVKNFESHLIFYLPLDTGIRVLHVIHSKRDWKGFFDDEAQ